MNALFSLLLLASSAPIAGDSVTGTVTSPDGQGVAYAVVAIPELSRETRAGPDGAFVIADVPAGRFTLVVRRAGYLPVVRSIEVTGKVAVNVTLVPTAFQVEPVTVTATRGPIAAEASPLPTAALAGERLRQAQGVSLAHVLEALPGMASLSTGAQIGKPVIRGLTGARVLVLENGSRLEDYSWSDEDGPSVETGFVRRVEVIRGPGSVLYGSDALGGVINVIPEPLPDAAGGRGFVRGGFTLSGASNNIDLGLAGRAEGARGTFGWRVAGVGRHGSNLHTPAGELDNTGFGAVNGEASAGWHGPRGALTFRLVHYGGEFKLLEANPPAAGDKGGPERRAGDDRLQVIGERIHGPWRFEAKGQYQRHSLIELSDDTVPGGGGAKSESEAFNLMLQTASLDLLAHHAAGTRLRGTLGLAGVAQWNDAKGRIPLVPDARLGTVAAFAFEQLQVSGRWSLVAGGRVDARRLHADSDAALGRGAQARNATAWSADAGVVWRALPDLAVSANAGRAWRAPTLFELFSNGPHLGEARYEKGDPTLSPETGRSLDVGVRWGGRRLRVELAGYDNRISDYIYIAPTAQFFHPSPTDSLRIYQHTQADAELTGGELSVEAEVARAVTLRVHVDGVRASNLTTHQPLPLVPPRRGGIAVEWRDGVEVAVESYAKQDRLNPLDVPTAGYTLLHLSGGTAVSLFGRRMRLDLALRNALNTRYRSFLSRYKEFALDPGRNLIVRLSTGDVD